MLDGRLVSIAVLTCVTLFDLYARADRIGVDDPNWYKNKPTPAQATPASKAMAPSPATPQSAPRLTRPAATATSLPNAPVYSKPESMRWRDRARAWCAEMVHALHKLRPGTVAYRDAVLKIGSDGKPTMEALIMQPILLQWTEMQWQWQWNGGEGRARIAIKNGAELSAVKLFRIAHLMAYLLEGLEIADDFRPHQHIFFADKYRLGTHPQPLYVLGYTVQPFMTKSTAEDVPAHFRIENGRVSYQKKTTKDELINLVDAATIEATNAPVRQPAEHILNSALELWDQAYPLSVLDVTVENAWLEIRTTPKRILWLKAEVNQLIKAYRP